MLTNRRGSIILGLLFLMQGCISFSTTTLGVNEADEIDYPSLGGQIFAKADQLSNELISSSETLNKKHPLYIRANEALGLILKTTKEDKLSIGGQGFLTHYGKFDYFDKSKIRLEVLVRDDPLAIVYPNGVLLVTTGLLDPELPYSAKNEAQLVGILAHEYSHLRDGHVLNQWGILEARQHELFNKFLSNLTQVLPIFTYNYKPGATHEEASHFDQVIEYDADKEALKIMEVLKYDKQEYIGFLARLRSYRDKYAPPSEEPYGWIDGRANALQQLLNPSNASIYVGDQTDKAGTKKRKVITLSAEEQYNLIALCDIYVSKNEKDKIVKWVQQPGEVDLNDLALKFTEPTAEIVNAFVLGIALNHYFGNHEGN